MKKLIFVLILPLTLIFSQTNEEDKPIDLTGKFALMFQIDENFNLNSFDGMSFAGKYFFNNELGVRLLVSTAYTESDESANKRITFNDNQRTEGVTSDRNKISYRIEPSLVYKLTSMETIRIFLGCGPIVSFSNDEDSYILFQDPNSSSRNRQIKNYSIGLNAFLSVEWFVRKDIALSAEYGFEYLYVETEYLDRKYENNQLTDELDQKTDSKLFQSLPVSLGISIYF